MISTITSKGQVTIPVELRRAAGLEVGTQVEFIVNARQRIELIPRHGDIRSLRGAVPKPTAPVSVDQMKAAVADGWTAVPAPNSTPPDDPESTCRIAVSPAAPPPRQ